MNICKQYCITLVCVVSLSSSLSTYAVQADVQNFLYNILINGGISIVQNVAENSSSYYPVHAKNILEKSFIETMCDGTVLSIGESVGSRTTIGSQWGGIWASMLKFILFDMYLHSRIYDNASVSQIIALMTYQGIRGGLKAAARILIKQLLTKRSLLSNIVPEQLYQRF